MKPILTLVCLVLAFTFLPGCLSSLQKACLDAMPVLTQGETYGTDAIVAIDQAEKVAESLPLPADVRTALDAAFNDARRGVAIGEIAINAAIQICTAKDPVTAFQDLISAWNKIESILNGNDAAKLRLAKAPIYVPAIVRFARSRTIATK